MIPFNALDILNLNQTPLEWTKRTIASDMWFSFHTVSVPWYKRQQHQHIACVFNAYTFQPEQLYRIIAIIIFPAIGIREIFNVYSFLFFFDAFVTIGGCIYSIYYTHALASNYSRQNIEMKFAPNCGMNAMFPCYRRNSWQNV